MSSPQSQVNNKQDVNEENIQLKVSAKNDLVKISLQPTNNLKRIPADIVCVIDISGSMSTEAGVQNANGVVEHLGLNILEIVKQAVLAIIYNLGPDDRLSIVSFTDKAFVDLDLTKMDMEGQLKAKAILEHLYPQDTTNLWQGLFNGLEVIRKGQLPNRIANKNVLILTDGQPNIIPRKGHIPMLKEYLKENPINCTVHTYGFGYQLDTNLLMGIAEKTQGMYSFIPDGGFVGTVFINTISNILTTMARSSKISLEPMNGAAFEQPLSNFLYKQYFSNFLRKPTISNFFIKQYENLFNKQNPNLINFNFGTVQYGQSRDIVIPMKFPKNLNNNPYLNIQLKYKSIRTSEKKYIQLKANEIAQDFNDVQIHKLRLLFIDQVRNAYELMLKKEEQSAQDILQNLIKLIKNSESCTDKYIIELLKDLEGQVTLAFSRRDWFDKWGQHYIPSLLRAHFLQQCNNFKDPGIQNYGGQLFKTLRDKGDEIFVKMPPLTQNRKVYLNPNFTMVFFHNSSNPCFDGNSLVQMHDSSFKYIKDLKKGDLVKAGQAHKNNQQQDLTAKIQCIVKTVCEDDVAELVQLPNQGPLVTPWHPVYINNQWVFPGQIEQAQKRKCEAVYSLVLEQSQHTVFVNGVESCTLGHGFVGNNVIEHPYFGTQKVIKDLKKRIGWYYGYVELKSGCIQRDYKTGLVNGLYGGFYWNFVNLQHTLNLYKFVMRRLVRKF